MTPYRDNARPTCASAPARCGGPAPVRTSPAKPPGGVRSMLAVLLSFTLVGTISTIACTPGQRQALRTVLDIVDTTCIIAHQALADAEVLRVCAIKDEAKDAAREVLSSSRTASAQAVAAAHVGACGPDAGALPNR